MLKIELVPDLDHCIETVTKREYDETLRCLLAAPEGDQELEKRLELLSILLHTVDFRKLRSESEKYLVEGRKVKFVFHLEGRTPKYEMAVK